MEQRVGRRRDVALRPAVHQPDDAGGAVHEGGARIARLSDDAGEERGRQIGQRGAAPQPLEPRLLEARPGASDAT